MKKQGNLLSFAFFGLFSQALTLALLGQQIAIGQWFGFLFAANAFMLYRAYIRQKKQEQEGFFKKELRRWWIRQEPENTISFAFVGAMLLVLGNFALWSRFEAINLWAMAFVAIALTQVLFEQARQLFNWGNAYLSEKWKNWRIKKMVRVLGEEKQEVKLRWTT